MNQEEKKLLALVRTTKKESRQIDFKERFNPDSAHDWCGIIKDIISMSNSGGGIILFGIKDDGHNANFNRNIILDIDPATISDKIYSYTNENFSEFKILEVNNGNRKFGAILISESQTPIVFIRNGVDVTQNKQKPAFSRGSVYFRHGTKSEPADTADIKRFIEKIINKTRKNWFEGVRKISNMGVNEEIIFYTKNAKTSLNELVKLSERGKLTKLTNDQIKKLRQEYPLSYKEVVALCKEKRPVKQIEIQKYINHCKENQSLSVNWKLVSKSLDIPANTPDRFTYSRNVVKKF